LLLTIGVGVIFAIAAVATCFDSGPAPAAENKTDPKFVWPKNSRFACSGVLAQEDGYRLTPDGGMLTWCSADIDDKDESRVLRACKPGQRCEIKGTITGHGAFTWVEITSVKALP